MARPCYFGAGLAGGQGDNPMRYAGGVLLGDLAGFTDG